MCDETSIMVFEVEIKKYEHGFHEECELQTLILDTCMYYCFWWL
jgi:hypothetical protein